jgi:hypothetical protein
VARALDHRERPARARVRDPLLQRARHAVVLPGDREDGDVRERVERLQLTPLDVPVRAGLVGHAAPALAQPLGALGRRGVVAELVQPGVAQRLGRGRLLLPLPRILDRRGLGLGQAVERAGRVAGRRRLRAVGAGRYEPRQLAGVELVELERDVAAQRVAEQVPCAGLEPERAHGAHDRAGVAGDRPFGGVAGR